MARDPEKTQADILQAAETEFSAKGLAGARVDEIARLAGANKRMIYHYFGNKEDLFKEVLRTKLRDKAESLEVADRGIAACLRYWFAVNGEDYSCIRLMEWEALELESDHPLLEEGRKQLHEAAVQQFREDLQAVGHDQDFDAGMTMLACMGMTMFPFAFPQLAYLTTGLMPDDPKFVEAYQRVLNSMGALIDKSGDVAGDCNPPGD